MCRVIHGNIHVYFMHRSFLSRGGLSFFGCPRVLFVPLCPPPLTTAFHPTRLHCILRVCIVYKHYDNSRVYIYLFIYIYACTYILSIHGKYIYTYICIEVSRGVYHLHSLVNSKSYGRVQNGNATSMARGNCATKIKREGVAEKTLRLPR